MRTLGTDLRLASWPVGQQVITHVGHQRTNRQQCLVSPLVTTKACLTLSAWQPSHEGKEDCGVWNRCGLESWMKILNSDTHRDPSSMREAVIVLAVLGVTSGRSSVHSEALLGLLELLDTIS